jgi:DNA (cytosine-5)-methyltransferase 1
MNNNLLKLKKSELLIKCKELNIRNYSSKNKDELIKLILNINIEQYENKNVNSLKFIDLFCGIGGFHQAMTKLGGQCVFACDIDDNCREIYERNYGLRPASDITKIDINQIPSFDILCAGFPCQPFSKAGQQKGFQDKRGNLFFNICDIIKHHNPKYLLLENVRNLSSHDNGNTWKTIYELITTLGYNTYKNPIILNVLHFNIPQNRERVIIMCKRKDLGELNQLPIIRKNPKLYLTCNIKDIINNDDIKLNNEYKVTGKMKKVEEIWDKFIKILISNKIKIPKFPIWTDWWDNDVSSNITFYNKYKLWIDKNRVFYNINKQLLTSWLETSRVCKLWIGAVRKFEWQAGEEKENDGMNTVLWTARGSGIRVKRVDYIPTLVAMSMIPVYGPESRKLTPRELLRLQSFPDTFEYDKKSIFKQVGNAVNVKMIENTAKFLILDDPLF